MVSILKFFKNLDTRFAALPPARKAGALALLAATIASLFVMALWLKAPDLELLYANLTEEDASAIVDRLKSQKIPYELTNRGRTIYVPSNKMHEIRLQLASEGLPESSEVGLEIFEKSGLGMNEFIQKINYQRALQGELARTIKTLDAVEQARVHLVIPKETLFIKEKPRGKASVTIKIRAGRSLGKEQVQGIVHLVSASVKGIEVRDVVVVDMEGNLLSGGSDATLNALTTATNFQHKLRVEQELENSIVEMLEDALGPGKVLARVTADLDFEKVERTEEIFDPDSQVVRSEQLMTEATLGALLSGGVAGAQSLVPGGRGGAGSGHPAKRDKENQTFNYEINKVIRHVSKPVGEITKLSVAVLIDGATQGDPPEYQPRSEKEMNKYLEIVKSTIGFNRLRGDTVQVENIQFDRSVLEEQQALLASEQTMDWVLLIAKIVGGAIVILLFFAWVIRPLMNWMTTSLEVLPEPPRELAHADMEHAEREGGMIPEVSQEMANVRRSVEEFVQNDPKFTASVIRKWMRSKGPAS
jgi:flagellar M-ring protein FliF